jgi:serine/threonine protein kinase
MLSIVRYPQYDSPTSTLYLARSNSEPIIVKKLKGLRIASKSHEILEEKITLWSQFSHPCFPQFMQLLDYRNELYIVRKYFVGACAEELLQKVAQLPLSTVKNFVTEICDGVEYMHSHSAVHGNLCPANILIRYTGHVAIIGLSRFLTGNTLAYAPNGFEAPEFEQDHLTPSADIYSVGKILELLLSKVDFSAISGNEIEKQLQSIVTLATLTTPSMRFATVATFRDALHKIDFSTIEEK